MSESPAPKVSVSIVTYNHAPFISQALDSVLAQKTTFPIEILVGEDDSSDGTREIVRRYAERHPTLIRPFFNDRKDVIRIEGVATGRRNLVNNLSNARGEYVALLEGDDYWINPAKLQRQVELLDARPDCSFCFHPAWVLDDRTGDQRPFHDVNSPIAERTEFSVEDLLFRWMVPTASIVFRRSMLRPLPDWFYEVISADQALQLLLAHEGNFLMVDEFMSVYRKHAGGLSSNSKIFSGPRYMRGQALLHKRFSAMHGHKYDAQCDAWLTSKLAQHFLGVAVAEKHLPLRPAGALKDLLMGLYYARKGGNLSGLQGLIRVARWSMRTSLIACHKADRWLRSRIAALGVSLGATRDSGTPNQ